MKIFSSLRNQILGIILFQSLIMGGMIWVVILHLAHVKAEIAKIIENNTSLIKTLTHVSSQQFKQEVLMEKAFRLGERIFYVEGGRKSIATQAYQKVQKDFFTLEKEAGETIQQAKA